MRLYLLTIDGKPAGYNRDDDGTWIWFADVAEYYGDAVRAKAAVFRSLSGLRRVQRQANETRAQSWPNEKNPPRYGYTIIDVPAAARAGGEG